MELSSTIALLINAFLVMMGVQALKAYVLPFIRVKAVWSLPIVASLAGLPMAQLTMYLSELVGAPIDLSPIAAVLSGMSTVVIYNVNRKGPRMGRKGHEKRKASRGLALLALFFLLPTLASAQGYDRNRGRTGALGAEEEDKPIIRLQITRWAFGVGSFFDQEAVTFSTEALYGAVQLHAIGFPGLKEGTSTGIVIEAHPGRLISKTIDDGLRIQSIVDDVDYRVWSVNRVPISAIPIDALQSGILSRTFVGTDLLLYEGGPRDYTGDFEARFVIGGDLGVLGPGNVIVEIYMLQQDVPIAFSIFYGF